VLEGIPQDLSVKITQSLSIPTIGIGAGISCDGQVLVTHDLLGFTGRKPPKFVKQYANLYENIIKSIETFKQEVQSGIFPSEDYTY
jgi:3-methyl-2-oxobutanoate hydroxymethyltransferase